MWSGSRWIGGVMMLFGLAMPAATGDQFILTAPESEAYKIAERHGLIIRDRIPERDVFLIEGPDGVSPEELIALLKDDPEIEDEQDKVFLEPNAVVRLPEAGLPKPLHTSTLAAEQALLDRQTLSYFGRDVWASYARQPAAGRVKLAEAHHAYGLGAAVVAVIDAGVDPSHPTLAGGLVDGYDFTRDVPEPLETSDLPAGHPLLVVDNVVILDNDCILPINHSTQALLDRAEAACRLPDAVPATFGHGTMVASLVQLVAPQARIMPLKAFGADGTGRLYNVIRALYYAQRNGASVVNLSLSAPMSSKALEDAMYFLHEKQMFSVAAAGNDGAPVLRYPAALSEPFGVASVSLDDRRSEFSNFGDELVAIAAPGEGLVAAYPGGRYALAWGTSFSAPLVSGTIALMLDVKSGINRDEVARAINRADPLADAGMGAGRLNVFRAVSDAAGVQP